MDASFLPPYPLGIRIGALERPDSMHLTHQPLTGLGLSEIDQRARPFFAARLLMQAPSPEMMRAGDDAGTDTFGDPNLVYEIANLGMYFEQVAGSYFEPLRIFGMNPNGIRIGYFV